MTIEVVLPGTSIGTSSFTGFSKLKAGGTDIDLGQSSTVSPRAIDYDADGRIDNLAGANGRILLYRNIGTSNEPVFASGVSVKAGGTDIVVGNGRLAISVVDMDLDGRFDLVATGSHDLRTRWFRNVGTTTAPSFNPAIFFKQPNGINDHIAADFRVEVADWNGDGLADIFTGSFDRFFQIAYNVGTATSPRFATPIGSAYQNPANRYDVNNDRSTSPLDVLLIINLLNSKGASLPVEGLPGPPDYVDVNGDKRVDPLDILELINFINKGSLGSGEGLESVDQAFASDTFYFSLDFDPADANTRNPRKPFKLKRGS